MPPEQLAAIPPETFSHWDWQGVDIRNEDAATEPGGPTSVQARAVLWAEQNLHDPLLIADHAAYELADLIAVEHDGARVSAHLLVSGHRSRLCVTRQATRANASRAGPKVARR